MIKISEQLSGIIENQREKIPVGMVMVWDTTNTVPSSGFYVRYYSGLNPNAVGAIKRTQFEPIIMKDWAGGIPQELSKYINTYSTNSGVTLSDPYTISYSGHYLARSSGVHSFSVRTNGMTEIYLDGAQILTGLYLISPGVYGNAQQLWNGRPFYWSSSTVLNTGWHPYRLDFRWPGINSGEMGSPFLSAYHTEPNSIEKNISASSVSFEPNFVTPVVLGGVMNITEDIDNELATQFSFEVSVTPSGEYAWNKAIDDYGNLKINRLCSIYMGYVTESGFYQTNGYTSNLDSCDGLIKKFTGSIDRVNVAQGVDTITATVTCRDFKKKLLNAINENYPNRSHYSPSIVSKVDALGRFDIEHLMPSAYDAWSCFSVLESLALSAGIDPININRAKWDTQNHFVMESNLNWPLTTTVDINGLETKDGDPYIHKYVYGENLYDESKRVADLIGYNFYFDRDGDLVVSEPRRTNRVEVYETGNYGSRNLYFSGNWNIAIDINASNRLYASPIGTNVSRLHFSGVGFGIYTNLYPSGPLYTVDIINSAGQNVFTNTYSSDSGIQYGFLNSVTRDLPEDTYDAYIKPSGAIRIEGFEYYSKNVFRPVYTLKDDRDISSINLDIDDYSLRNEIIAVGQQISDKGYLYSKAIDLDSISNPNAFNYTGQKRTFVLIEPTIQSQKRLDWLSSAILEKFRRKQRTITVTTQGLPHLEVNDPVGVISRKLSLDNPTLTGYNINNNDVYYITKISSNLTKGEYRSTISLSSLKPIDSWRPPLSITTDILNKIYQANNNSIFNNFRQDTLNSAFGYGFDGFSEQAAFLSFDLLIDVDRLWVLVADQLDGGSVFKNIDVNSKSPLLSFQIANGQTPYEQPKSAVWLHNGGGERWGRITVPTANNKFNDGQWAGQNSESKVRLSGSYPIAIWAQFRTADNATVIQGIWVPTSGQIDPRNMTSGWSSTSQYNTYISYNSANADHSLQTPINPSLQLTDLPAFVVKNSPMLVNMWLGPIASGYKMVDNNKLVSMTGNFTHFGDKWNIDDMDVPHLTHQWGYHDWFQNLDGATFHIAPKYWPTSTVVTLPNGKTINTPNGPWVVGDNILNTGTSPTGSEMVKAIAEVYKEGSVKTKADYRNVFGWTPQGVDYINIPATGYPSYVSYPYSISSENSAYTSGALEVLNHYGNYITFKPNRDIYLKYSVCVLEYQPQSRSYSYDGSTPIEWQTWVASIAADTVSVGPFKSEIAIYLGPGEMVPLLEWWGTIYANPGPTWGAYSPRNSNQYYKFKGKTNVINNKNDSVSNLIVCNNGYQNPYRPPSEGIHRQYPVFHLFEITDAKTGEKYNFTMKTSRSFIKRAFAGNPPISEIPQFPSSNIMPRSFTDISQVNTSISQPRQYPRVLP